MKQVAVVPFRHILRGLGNGLGEVDVSVICRGKYRICLLRIEQTFEECASFAIAYSSERVDIIWLLVLQEVVA